jgi:ABC-2 type transport system permease protein
VSPVYEKAYEAWEGTRTSRWRRIAAIAGNELRRGASSVWVWLLWVATVVHVSVRGFVLWAAGSVQQAGGEVPPQADVGGLSAGLLGDALAFQSRWILLLLLAVVAAGVLARDLDAGALTFYFSKPIPRSGYALAKVAAPFLLALSVTAIPVLVVWLLGVAFTPEALHPDGVYWLPLKIVGASLVVSAAASLVAVALSGLTRSTNVAAGVWVGLGLVSYAAANLLIALTGVGRFALVEPAHGFLLAARDLLGAAAPEAETGLAWLVTGAWALAGAAAVAYVLRDEGVGS